MTSEKMSKKGMKMNLVRVFLFSTSIILMAVSYPPKFLLSQQEDQPVPLKKPSLLRLLDLMPSAESIDFLQEKISYQLHELPAEQRHPKTWNLSQRIEQDLEAGLHMLFAVDEDIAATLKTLQKEPNALDRAAQAVEQAILSGGKIYLFGGEETGRWMKEIESSLWRPFWTDLKERKKIWSKISPRVGDSIEERLIGEMPGADRSLIHPLPGMADLMLIGRLQLLERGIEPGDAIICTSGSGSTPAVIGAITEGLSQWKRRYPYDAEEMKKQLYFCMNNPEEVLISFDHVRAVLEEPAITKIDLSTGPQALTGNLRLQAATIDTFVIGNIIRTAIDRTLRAVLSSNEMESLGFQKAVVLSEKLEEFSPILKKVNRAMPSLARLIRLEENALKGGHSVTYSALEAANSVFNECSERSSAFFLPPLDTIKAQIPRSQIQVWALKEKQEEAWLALLGRPFRGLSTPSYEKQIEEQIADPQLRQISLESLTKAGEDQQFLYNFAFSDYNLRNHGPEKGDLGILVMISPEEEQFDDKKSIYNKFLGELHKRGAQTALIFVTENSEEEAKKIVRKMPSFDLETDAHMVLALDEKDDPLGLNMKIALKITLNALSNSVMARTGRVVGNSIPDFDPENPKSVDRATYIIQSYVNDVLQHPQWVKQHGIQVPINYGEANAILYDAISYMKNKKDRDGHADEVGLSIVRVLESLRQVKAISKEEALQIVRKKGLEIYLKDVVTQEP